VCFTHWCCSKNAMLPSRRAMPFSKSSRLPRGPALTVASTCKGIVWCVADNMCVAIRVWHQSSAQVMFDVSAQYVCCHERSGVEAAPKSCLHSLSQSAAP
jgi:hypothetical protein